MYVLVRILGLWSIFAITQLRFGEPYERVNIFSCALLITFAYLFTVRNFILLILTLYNNFHYSLNCGGLDSN